MRRRAVPLAFGASLAVAAAALAQVSPPLDEPQISRPLPGAAGVSAPDVPGPRAAHVAAEQVGPVAHSASRPAEAPAPLSQPAQGRDVSTVRVEGRDRCDPTATGPSPAGCDRILERRSAEFDRPGPAPVSPEARLLLKSAPDLATADARDAARTLASGAVSDQLAAEAIAAATTQPPPSPAPPGVSVTPPR